MINKNHGKLSAAAIFSDNMVLQHGKPVPFWGTGGAEGSSVFIIWKTASDTVKKETTVRGAEWSLMLPPLSAGVSGEIIIKNEADEIRFTNVITGDVWFAGGQSNMEMELVNCKNGQAELASCANLNIRFYQVVKRAIVDDDYLREETESCWKVCAPDTAAMLSAAAFFFAQKINAEIKIPIGIINCSWGGTSISAWMSEQQLNKTTAGRRFIDDYAQKIGNKTDMQYNAEMEDYFEQWQKWDERIRIRREKEPDVSWEVLNRECGECPWPQPAGRTSPYCPANLHTARIKRTAPFAIKGFIYYQGEEDDLRAVDYREMMYYLIEQWRNDWNDNSLPFLFVQLPMFASRQEAESGNPQRHWCLIRENQYLASLDIANTGLAVIIDCGEFDNIHPFDKQTVGFRLALQALKKVYGADINADAPVFSWAEEKGSALHLHFDNAQSGLEFRGDIAKSFEVAGDQGEYYPARAEIKDGSVIVSSDMALSPKRARYAWVKYGPTPLYAKNGLAAMPFRTNRNEPIDC
ncbi:MAG: sialate O-acetylesterase [Treponema sp.]|jgi:sialate O-acetylesterase|nr:sialate O-acetylesterase [Treponema sp.]